MCYRIVSHSARCDVRTIVVGANANEAYVDPYAQPRNCFCEDADNNIKPWLQCPHHKCCRITSRWRRCDKVTGDDLCPAPTPYHKYEPTRSNTWYPRDHGDLSTITQDYWHAVPELDANIGSLDNREGRVVPNSSSFNARREMMLSYGRLAFESLLESLSAQQELEDIQGKAYCDHHNICERVLMEWECPASRAAARVEEICQRLHQLEQNRATYRLEFLRWKAWLAEMISEGEGHCTGLMIEDIAYAARQTDTRIAGKRKPQLSITIPRCVMVVSR